MKRSVVISLALAFVAIAVLANGLTGMATIDLNKQYCDSDSDCSNKCCLFYNSNSGVCDKASSCNSIKLLSMEQSSGISLASNPKLESRLPNLITSNLQFGGRVNIWSSIVAAALLLVISLFILMAGNRRGI